MPQIVIAIKFKRMTKIDLTLKTAEGNVEFEIVKLEGKFHVFNKIIDYHGKNKTMRIGQTTSWPDVVSIAKIFTGKQVVGIEKTNVRNN